MKKPDGPLMRFYTRLVTWSVRYRLITIALGVILFAAALYGGKDCRRVSCRHRTRRGHCSPSSCRRSQLTDTEAVTDAIVNRVRKRDEVESVFVDGGRIPPILLEVGKAALTINYVPKSKRSLSQQQLENAISQELADIPDVRYWFLNDNGQRNVKFIVTGQDSATVGNVASGSPPRCGGCRWSRMSYRAPLSIGRS